VRRYHHAAVRKYSEDGHLEAVLACSSPDLTNLQPLSGVVAISGYVLAQLGIEQLDVYLDNELLGQAHMGLTDVQVARQYPTFENRRQAGFIFRWDTTKFGDGEYDVRLVAVAKQGSPLEIMGRVWINNSAEPETPYAKHISVCEAEDIRKAQSDVSRLESHPVFSVIVPIGNSSEMDVLAALDSVREQIYEAWELCICYSAGQTIDWLARFKIMEVTSSRIRIQAVRNVMTGEAVVNSVVNEMNGEFVIILDPRNRLAVHALYEFAVLLNDSPDADLIYADDDIIDPDGYRRSPFFKPDWSHDLLLSCDYIGPACVLRRERITEIGGLLPGYESLASYELYLRMSEHTQKIYHVAKVLVHGRAHGDTNNRYVPDAITALNDHLNRQHSEAQVVPLIDGASWRVVYEITTYPSVSIIIPTTGHFDLIVECVQAVRKVTTYPNYEFVIVDNSSSGRVESYVQSLNDGGVVCQYVDFRAQSFNYSAMNNDAVKVTKSPLVLFLNDDVTPLHAGWLHEMVSHAQRLEVGAAGAKLLYPDGRIQHAGSLVGLPNGPTNAFRGVFEDDATIGRARIRHQVVGNWSAVTGACLMTRRDVFEEVGGFDASHFPVGFQDIDLCLKMAENGYRILYTPFARLVHAESTTRLAPGNVNYYDTDPTELTHFLKKWSHIVGQDPFYNPNLSQRYEDFRLRVMDS